ncbi:MAG: helix-turn-helix domain-containing protein [Oscillospiraceae bacterium]|nr:helix-turn-helix domain-containing protein [Oscillospiraceae bacterium]
MLQLNYKINYKTYNNRKGLDIMTMQRKKEILTQMMSLITEMAEDNPDAPVKAEPEKVEMLTIKECTEAVHGFSEHSIRQLVTQGKIPHIRAGLGKHGKILINKADLLAYLKATA